MKKLNIVIKLLIINLAVFILINLLHVFLYLFNAEDNFNHVIEFLAVPSGFRQLFMRLWSPFTYMFVHENFWHILGNMLWLYFLGTILNHYIKEKDFLGLYILGGFAGAFAFVVAYNIFPVFSDIKDLSIAIGASASVTAIVLAVATYKPQHEINLFGILPIKLFIIAIVVVVIDIFRLRSDNSGGHFAHLGGAVFGFIYGWYLRKGVTLFPKFANFTARLFTVDFTPKSKMKVVKNNLRTKNDYDYNVSKNDIKQEIDRILDKISQSGYQSLSNKEKDYLNKFGKNL